MHEYFRKKRTSIVVIALAECSDNKFFNDAVVVEGRMIRINEPTATDRSCCSRLLILRNLEQRDKKALKADAAVEYSILNR